MADSNEDQTEKAVQKVGYKSPPANSRFKPGQSGNPSGRAKGSQNLKTLFQKILKEQVSLREGSELRKVSKAEALMRGLVVGALKGDTRSLGTLFRLAEQTGEFDDPAKQVTSVTRVIVGWKDYQDGGVTWADRRATKTAEIPGNRELDREDDD